MLNGKPLLSFPSVVVSKNGTTTMVVASATLIIEPSTKTINPTKRAVLISHPPRGKLTGTSIQILGVGLPRHLSCGLRVCLALTDEEQGFGCLSIRRITAAGRGGLVGTGPQEARPEEAARRRGRTGSSHALHRQAHRFAAAEADGRDPPPDLALLHGAEQRGEAARPARADRV